MLHRSPAMSGEASMNWRLGRTCPQDSRKRVLGAEGSARHVAPWVGVSVSHVVNARQNRATGSLTGR
jgi:hypothetical protein